MTGRRRAFVVFASAAWAVCVAGLVGCDHATKVVAESSLHDRGPVVLLPDVIDLRYSENRDIAFDGLSRLSLHLPAERLVFAALVGTLATIGLWIVRRRAPWPEHLGFALVVGGALGNMIDRADHGHVIDFIHVRGWPVFNVADVLIVIGLGVLLWVHRKRATPVARAS